MAYHFENLKLEKGMYGRSGRSFTQTLEELVVEGCCLAEEMTQYNAELHQRVCSQMAGMPVDHVPHETFKVMTQQAQAIIRTGETSKYANIILYAGVNF